MIPEFKGCHGRGRRKAGSGERLPIRKNIFHVAQNEVRQSHGSRPTKGPTCSERAAPATIYPEPGQCIGLFRENACSWPRPAIRLEWATLAFGQCGISMLNDVPGSEPKPSGKAGKVTRCFGPPSLAKNVSILASCVTFSSRSRPAGL